MAHSNRPRIRSIHSSPCALYTGSEVPGLRDCCNMDPTLGSWLMSFSLFFLPSSPYHSPPPPSPKRSRRPRPLIPVSVLVSLHPFLVSPLNPPCSRLSHFRFLFFSWPPQSFPAVYSRGRDVSFLVVDVVCVVVDVEFAIRGSRAKSTRWLAKRAWPPPAGG